MYLSHEVTACLSITLSPSPPLHIPSGPLSSRSTELLFIVTGRTVRCITVALYCKGLFRRKCCCESVKSAGEPLHNICLMLNESKHEHNYKMRQRNEKCMVQVLSVCLCEHCQVRSAFRKISKLFHLFPIFFLSIDSSPSLRVQFD